MPLPDYDFLPGPLWLITLLQLVTLTLHLFAMNFLVGGVIILLWGKIRDRWNDPAVKTYLSSLPAAMAATITLGVAPLLFLQVVYPKQFYAASIVSGWFWLAIVPVLIITYYCLYAAAFSQAPGAGPRPRYLLLAFIGMLYVSFMFSSVSSLAERPDLIAATYAREQSGCIVNPDLPDYFFRWLHMLFGALTVGGFFVGLVGRRSEPVYRVGRGFYLWGMGAAAIFGLAYLFTLGEYLVPLMRTPAIWVLTLGVALSAVSLHFYFRKRFWIAGTMLGVSMLSMVYTRHTVRLLRLSEHFDPATVTVKPQWSVFLMFLISFLVMVAVMVWMLRAFSRGRAAAAGETS